MINLSESNFDKFINSPEKVLVKFGAEWCGPCRAMEPILESVSESFPERIGSVDVDSNKEISLRFAIRSIPTIIIFQDGKEIEKKIGSATQSVIESLIQN